MIRGGKKIGTFIEKFEVLLLKAPFGKYEMRRTTIRGIPRCQAFILTYIEADGRSKAAMARKPRVEYAGAFYHVLLPGQSAPGDISSDADREYYLERLEEYRQKPKSTL